MLLDSITVNVSTTSSVYMLLLNDKDVYEFSHLYMHVNSIYTILNFNNLYRKYFFTQDLEYFSSLVQIHAVYQAL